MANNGASRVRLIRGSSVKPRTYDWLWPGWLAKGKMHLLAGKKGAGKSTLVFSLFAAISGECGKWPDGTKAPTGSVLVWSSEDDFEDTILPRFLAAGGDPDRLYHIGGVRIAGGKERPFNPAVDMEDLLDEALKISDLRAVMIDPVVMAVDKDSHRNAEVRQGLQPIVDFAKTTGAAVVGITHFTKWTDGKDPLQSVTGSLAFTALPRVVWGAASTKDDGTMGRLVRMASNIGPKGGGFEYVLSQEPVPGHDFNAQRVHWGAALEGSAWSLLDGDEHQSAIEEAKQFLRDALRDGPMAHTDIKAAATANGHAWRTVERAKQSIGIEAIRGDKLDPPVKGWCWRLPVITFSEPTGRARREDRQEQPSVGGV